MDDGEGESKQKILRGGLWKKKKKKKKETIERLRPRKPTTDKAGFPYEDIIYIHTPMYRPREKCSDPIRAVKTRIVTTYLYIYK